MCNGGYNSVHYHGKRVLFVQQLRALNEPPIGLTYRFLD